MKSEIYEKTRQYCSSNSVRVLYAKNSQIMLFEDEHNVLKFAPHRGQPCKQYKCERRIARVEQTAVQYWSERDILAFLCVDGDGAYALFWKGELCALPSDFGSIFSQIFGVFSNGETMNSMVYVGRGKNGKTIKAEINNDQVNFSQVDQTDHFQCFIDAEHAKTTWKIGMSGEVFMRGFGFGIGGDQEGVAGATFVPKCNRRFQEVLFGDGNSTAVANDGVDLWFLRAEQTNQQAHVIPQYVMEEGTDGQAQYIPILKYSEDPMMRAHKERICRDKICRKSPAFPPVFPLEQAGGKMLLITTDESGVPWVCFQGFAPNPKPRLLHQLYPQFIDGGRPAEPGLRAKAKIQVANGGCIFRQTERGAFDFIPDIGLLAHYKPNILLKQQAQQTFTNIKKIDSSCCSDFHFIYYANGDVCRAFIKRDNVITSPPICWARIKAAVFVRHYYHVAVLNSLGRVAIIGDNANKQLEINANGAKRLFLIHEQFAALAYDTGVKVIEHDDAFVAKKRV